MALVSSYNIDSGIWFCFGSIIQLVMNSFPVTDENCEEFKRSNKGAIMTCPFEEPLEGQHTDRRGVPLFFVPFSEYVEEFRDEDSTDGN